MSSFAKKNNVSINTHSMESMMQATQVENSNRAIANAQSITDPILRSMGEQGMTGTYAFGPGTPIKPTQPFGSEPRQYEYMIGQNIVQAPRANEAINFAIMESIIEMYDIAQMAIEVRQDELRNLDWTIVATDERDNKKYESEIKQIRQFFEKPDGHMLFDDFQNQIAYDWLAFDALSIYPHMTKGGKLGALEPIDGKTISMLVDYYGRIPQAPAPAYVQWAYGMPWVWLDRDNLIYRPHRRRTNKLYGFSPVEWMLTAINTDIRYQLYFLQYFTDGSVPDTWVNAPEGLSAEQIKQFQEMYDVIMNGNQVMKHRVKWIPFGSQVKEAKDSKFDVNFPQFMLQKACAAWKVTPAELGFTEKVNKSSGEAQENVQYRRSIRPSAMFFTGIYTHIIHKYFGLPNLRFRYLNVDEQEDLLIIAQRDEIYIRNAVLSADEVRLNRLGMNVKMEDAIPRIFMAGSNIIPASQAINSLPATAPDNAQANEPKKVPDKKENVVPDIIEQDGAKKAALDFFANPMMGENF